MTWFHYTASMEPTIEQLIERYSDQASFYAVAFVLPNGLISVYDDEDEHVSDFTESEFREWMAKRDQNRVAGCPVESPTAVQEQTPQLQPE
jgi:NifB/MoaA-like Fe-S oxidoreductase